MLRENVQGSTRRNPLFSRFRRFQEPSTIKGSGNRLFHVFHEFRPLFLPLNSKKSLGKKPRPLNFLGRPEGFKSPTQGLDDIDTESRHTGLTAATKDTGRGGLTRMLSICFLPADGTAEPDKDNVLSADLEVDNRTACVSPVRIPFIIDGRTPKSVNRHWNREKLQSILGKRRLL